MNNLKIHNSIENFEEIFYLYCEIYPKLCYNQNYENISHFWKEIINNEGLILKVKSEEFDFPLAYCILVKNHDELKIISAGVKEGFRKQGIWDYLFDYINFYAEDKGLTLSRDNISSFIL